jgi:coenzyme PQQ precursor peptide PqqA
VIVGPRADELYRIRKGPVFLCMADLSLRGYRIWSSRASRLPSCLPWCLHLMATRITLWAVSLARIRLARVSRERSMTWTTPTLVEICIGLEINGYLPAEF